MLTFDETIAWLWLSGERRAAMLAKCVTDNGRQRVNLMYDILEQMSVEVEPHYKGAK